MGYADTLQLDDEEIFKISMNYREIMAHSSPFLSHVPHKANLDLITALAYWTTVMHSLILCFVRFRLAAMKHLAMVLPRPTARWPLATDPISIHAGEVEAIEQQD